MNCGYVYSRISHPRFNEYISDFFYEVDAYDFRVLKSRCIDSSPFSSLKVRIRQSSCLTAVPQFEFDIDKFLAIHNLKMTRKLSILILSLHCLTRFS